MKLANKSLLRKLSDLVVNSYRFNDSQIYQSYLRLRHPSAYAQKQRERAFYGDLIRQVGGGIVFDIGANGGSKAVIFAEFAQRVVCVEPSPAAVSVLQERFAKFANVSIVSKGAGATAGSLPFHMFDEADCYNTFSSKWADTLRHSAADARATKDVREIVEVPITTLDLLIEQFGTPTYIKIDVEGFEVEVLRGLTKPVKTIGIECNLPEFESETLECLHLLDNIHGKAQFNYSTTEPPAKFAAERWLSRSQMARVVTDKQYKFMEIYAQPELM